MPEQGPSEQHAVSLDLLCELEQRVHCVAAVPPGLVAVGSAKGVHLVPTSSGEHGGQLRDRMLPGQGPSLALHVLGETIVAAGPHCSLRSWSVEDRSLRGELMLGDADDCPPAAEQEQGLLIRASPTGLLAVAHAHSRHALIPDLVSIHGSISCQMQDQLAAGKCCC